MCRIYNLQQKPNARNNCLSNLTRMMCPVGWTLINFCLYNLIADNTFRVSSYLWRIVICVILQIE